MKISTKGRYALRMLIDLAMHQENGYISLKEISERQELSKKYLEQIVPLMNKSGLLKTNRGFQGGYRLSKPASQITVGEVLVLTEGSLAPVACLDDEENTCPRRSECITLPVWEGLNKVIREYLFGLTLQDVIDSAVSADGSDYCI